MHRKVLTVAVCALLVTSARQASAPAGTPWTDRGYVNVNVGFETTSGTLTDTTTFQLYEETGTKSVTSVVDSGSLIDFSLGARVWRNVSAGIGYHRGTTSGEASVEASVPNPIFFNQERRLAFDVADLSREEYAFHLQLGYMLVLNDKVNVHLLAGPSFFRLKQDVVSDVSIAETGQPFTTVDGTAVVVGRKSSITGFNVGADVSYIAYVRPSLTLGAGAFVRYTGASGKVAVLTPENQLDSDVGGIQIGFGARLRF